MTDTINPVSSQPVYGPVAETAGIGNRDARLKQVTLSSAHAVATFIGVRWDGDKVRGIRVELSDGTSAQAGGYNDAAYTLTQYRFAAGETLSKAWLRDSGYGYRSVREVEFVTSRGASFKSGAGGFDNEVSLAVDGAFLVGFHAWVNPDNFINGLAFDVRKDVPPKPVVQRPWFETNSIGNRAAGANQVQSASNTSVVRSLEVRWDGDKVRGIRLTLRDGSITSAGGIDDINYTLTSYTFTEDETLQTLSMSSSGYGGQSLRRLEFTTNKGAHIVAGPGGIDDLITPPVAGGSIVGFHAWVNVDNFINALAFRVTDDAPLAVNLRNYSPWTASYANGMVVVNGKPAIQIAPVPGNTHGLITTHTRGAMVVSGPVVGYCAFNGAAPLNISLFGDGTFEAKFSVDDGDGAVSGAIAGVTAPTTKPVLIDALVRKYAPIFMLNVDEVYWPSTVDAFLPNMILQRVNNNGTQSDFFTGVLNRNVLAAQAMLLGGNNTKDGAALRTRADLNQPSDTQDWFNGVRPQDGSQVTSYAVVVEGQNGRLDIVYWWFFNYNQGKNVANTSWGNHVSDWEHVRVQLANVDFTHPGQEHVLSVMFDHHGDQETLAPGAGADMSGRQVLVHLANGDHECYPKTGVYNRPGDTHDYCKENAYRFDQRIGTIEIYRWSGSDFLPVPAGATPAFKDPNWLGYQGRWGNWQRGDMFGLIARLETGPEGLKRPGEYPVPS